MEDYPASTPDRPDAVRDIREYGEMHERRQQTNPWPAYAGSRLKLSDAVGSTVEDFTSDFTDVPHLGGLSRLALTPFRLVDPDAFLSVNA